MHGVVIPADIFHSLWDGAELNLSIQGAGRMDTLMRQHLEYDFRSFRIVIQGNPRQRVVRDWPTFRDAQNTLSGILHIAPQLRYKEFDFAMWRLDQQGRRTVQFGYGFVLHVGLGNTTAAVSNTTRE